MEGNRRTRRLALNRNAVPAILDELEFTTNKSSVNARKIGNKIEQTSIDFWIDKHYHIRSQHGDQYGKREGIEPERVKEIIEESLKHLIFYSAVVKNFSFLNYNANPSERSLRVVCQKTYNNNKTNVIIEAHVLTLSVFEITIFTAMQADEFKLSDGQYSIELLGGGNSILYHFSRGVTSEIASI